MRDARELACHSWYQRDLDAWVREVVHVHFHPERGSPYWIQKAAQLGIDATAEIRSAHDLIRLGPMDTGALTERPVEDFLPRARRIHRGELIFVESSGTTGSPSTACFTREDFLGAFVASFQPVAEPLGFPRGESWLYIGPTGPHAIGRAARELPSTLGSPEPFCVDFDPRWVRKLPEGSVARERYMTHLIEQASAIMERESPATLFATPPTLLSLSEQIGEARRQRVRGIHFGGMEVTVELRQALRAAFPAAAFLSGYGNSLFGVALELGGDDDRHMDYFPAGPRHLIRVLKGEDAIDEDAAYGQSGRILMSRLDLSGFFPNVLERDHGTRIPPPEAARKLGFLLDGVRDPHPPRKGPRMRTGFY